MAYRSKGSFTHTMRRACGLAGHLVTLGLALLGASVLPTRSVACPACQCGNPAWSLDAPEAGVESPLRVGLVFRTSRTTHGMASTGQAVEADRRGSLLLSRALGRGRSVSVIVPYLNRIHDDVSGGRTSTFAMGDIEVRGQLRMAQSNTAIGFLTFGVSVAAAVPSGPRLRDELGTIVDVDAQPGLGSWAGAGGLYADTRAGRWGARATVELRGATLGWEGHQPPTTFLYSLSARRRFGRSSGLQLGIDGRNSGHDAYDGIPDRLSGGHTLFLSPRWSQSLGSGWGLQIGGQFPLVLKPEPHARETGSFEFGLHWGA